MNKIKLFILHTLELLSITILLIYEIILLIFPELITINHIKIILGIFIFFIFNTIYLKK